MLVQASSFIGKICFNNQESYLVVTPPYLSSIGNIDTGSGIDEIGVTPYHPYHWHHSESTKGLFCCKLDPVISLGKNLPSRYSKGRLPTWCHVSKKWHEDLPSCWYERSCSGWHWQKTPAGSVQALRGGRQLHLIIPHKTTCLMLSGGWKMAYISFKLVALHSKGFISWNNTKK